MGSSGSKPSASSKQRKTNSDHNHLSACLRRYQGADPIPLSLQGAHRDVVRGHRLFKRETVFLNVYDLHPSNAVLHRLGIGIYHSAIQVHGVEWAYGGSEEDTYGVFTTKPIHFVRSLIEEEIASSDISADAGHLLLSQIPKLRYSMVMGTTLLAPSAIDERLCNTDRWNAREYSLLFNNCNHFSDYALKKLVGKRLPKWVNRLARSGERVTCCLPKWIKTSISTQAPTTSGLFPGIGRRPVVSLFGDDMEDEEDLWDANIHNLARGCDEEAYENEAALAVKGGAIRFDTFGVPVGGARPASKSEINQPDSKRRGSDSDRRDITRESSLENERRSRRDEQCGDVRTRQLIAALARQERARNSSRRHKQQASNRASGLHSERGPPLSGAPPSFATALPDNMIGHTQGHGYHTSKTRSQVHKSPGRGGSDVELASTPSTVRKGAKTERPREQQARMLEGDIATGVRNSNIEGTAADATLNHSSIMPMLETAFEVGIQADARAGERTDSLSSGDLEGQRLVGEESGQ